jgi:hypothetical protein
MSLKSIINGSKEVYALVDHETNEEKKCSNEENENSPQLSNLLRIKRGRKTDKTDYKIHDRESPDNIRRKVKTHFHNFMVALLNMKIRHIFKLDEKFGKISFKMTQDLSVEYNKKLFKTKIKDIIIVMSNKYSNQNRNRNRIILNEIMKKVDNNEELILLLNLNYEDLYLDYYLKSDKETFKGEEEDESYEAHQEKLKKKFGNIYANKFKNIAESLIDFFYKCKKREIKQKLIAPSFVNFHGSIINYNEKKYEIRNAYHRNSFDRGTQTEIYISDDE